MRFKQTNKQEIFLKKIFIKSRYSFLKQKKNVNQQSHILQMWRSPLTAATFRFVNSFHFLIFSIDDLNIVKKKEK